MADDTFTLPPPPKIGTRLSDADESAVVNYVYGLMEEAYDVRKDHDDQADRNANLHEGRSRLEEPAEGQTPVDVNRVRNVDIAHVQVQTEETPRIKLTARETGEPGKAYLDLRVDLGRLDNPQLKTVLAQLDPAAWQVQGEQRQSPLSDVDRATVEAAIAAGILPAEVLVVASDRVKADAEQTLFDAMWEQCKSDFYVGQAVFKKTVVGWQFMSYGFDDTRKRHMLFNPSHLQVFVDPTCTDITEAAHAELLQFKDLRRAQAEYPWAADEFEDAAIVGQASTSQTLGNFRIPAVYQNANFRRKMVPMIHCWIRDYAFPLSQEEAKAGGHVIQDDVEVSPAVPDETDESGAVTFTGRPAVTRPRLRLATRPAQGPDETMHPDDLAQRRAHDPGAPALAAWPSRPGLAEICIVGQTVVSYRLSEFVEIPLVHFVDLPLVEISPYGQGQPEALEPLQLALNALLTDIVTYFHYFGTPPVAMPVGVAKKIPGFSENAYRCPYREIWEIPDDLIQKYGDISKLVGFIPVPGLPADFWKFLDLLLMLIDKEGQVTEALEGEGKAHWSGEMVGRLQEAARGLIAWKSQRVEFGLQYMAGLMLHSHRTRLSIDDCMAISSKYPRPIWEEIKAQPAAVDITVEITAGGGRKRDAQKSDSLTLWANGQGPLSNTTLLERFGEDPKVENQNKITEAEAQAKGAAQIRSVSVVTTPPGNAGVVPPGGAAPPVQGAGTTTPAVVAA